MDENENDYFYCYLLCYASQYTEVTKFYNGVYN